MPALYERYLGPLLFEPYALDLADRLRGFDGRLLETAAGTGIVTRTLARTLPTTAAIVATDISQPMLDQAAQILTAGNLVWRQADALRLPFEDASFDAVICQFGVMFFPDKPAGFAEARRVLRPDGRFLFSVWDRIAENEIAEIVSETVAHHFPLDPPSFLARTPYGYHDTDLIRSGLEAAGFARVDIETLARRGRTDSPADPAIGFCQGTPLRNEIEARDAGRLDEVTDAAAQAIAQRFGTGPIDGKLQAHIVTAVA